MERNAISLIVGTLVGLLIVTVYLLIRTEAVVEAPVELSKKRFMQTRLMPWSPPTVLSPPRETQNVQAKRAPIEQVSREAIDPAQAFASGDEGWEDTVLTLNDLFWLREERLQCAQDFAMALTTACQADYELVIRPDDGASGFGTIVDGDVTTSAFDEPMTEVDAAACDAYVRCLLNARIGSTLPIPSGRVGMFSIRQPIVYEWASASMFDPQRVRELISMYQSSISTKPKSLSGEERLFYRDEEQLLAYLEYHLDLLTSEPQK